MTGAPLSVRLGEVDKPDACSVTHQILVDGDRLEVRRINDQLLLVGGVRIWDYMQSVWRCIRCGATV